MLQPNNVREIPGWKGYFASDKGEVYGPRFGLTRPLKYSVDDRGRKYINGRAKSKGRRLAVHTAVLLAWRGFPSSNEECRHLNGDLQDNRLSNLVWGSHSENMKDKIRHDTYTVPGFDYNKMLQYNADLSHDEVREIRKRLAKGEKGKDLADSYNVSQNTISRIKNNKTYKHVK